MIKFVQGGIAQDDRGEIRFVNDFDMSAIKRFYVIKNADVNIVRGWKGHRKGQRWFYVLSGSFSIDVVKVDNWDAPSNNLPIENFELCASAPQVLHLSEGYATAIKALEDGSQLLVYADQSLVESINDDFTFPLNHFINRSSS